MSKLCDRCGRPLTLEGGLALCLPCNRLTQVSETPESEKVVIECPGATLYDVETGEIIQGVRWHDPQNPAKGFEMVGRPLYAPNHKSRRLIEPEQEGRITRCRACQDYTVRMRARQTESPAQPGPSAARRRAENLFRD